MSALKNLGFGSSRVPFNHEPKWGVRGVDDYGGSLSQGWKYSEPDEFGSYESSAAMPGAAYAGGPVDPAVEDEDFLKKLMAQLGKQGKGDKGKGQGLLDVYQGMQPVQPFSIIGRPRLG